MKSFDVEAEITIIMNFKCNTANQALLLHKNELKKLKAKGNYTVVRVENRTISKDLF